MSRADTHTRLDDLTASYITELETSRNRLRGDIINLYRDQVDTHALAAALEQENDQLRAQIASAKSQIASMENILKEKGVYASNHVESRISSQKLKPMVAVSCSRLCMTIAMLTLRQDRKLIDISDEDEIQLDLGGRTNSADEEEDRQFQKGKGNQHLDLTKKRKKHMDKAATSGENSKRRKLIASKKIEQKGIVKLCLCFYSTY